jgi:hypothetical protein
MAKGANLQDKYPFYKLTFNYFAEYHGKCICDSHFSTLSNYYREKTISFAHKHPIYTTKEFINILKQGVFDSNKATAHENGITRKKHSNKSLKDLLYVIFFEYLRTQETHSENIEQITTPNFTCYYYFTFPTETQIIKENNIPTKKILVSKILAGISRK